MAPTRGGSVPVCPPPRGRSEQQKSAIFRLDLKGIANSAIVPGLTPQTERRLCAALDQRAEKPLLFEGVSRAYDRDLGVVWKAEGDRLVGHERTAACERCAKPMHCVAQIFQQRSLVFRAAG